MHITVHNCRTQHSTQQFWLSSLLTSGQSSQLRCCPLKKHKSHLMALCQDYLGELLPEGKTNLDFTEARDMSGSGISWGICKPAPRSRQITTSAPHHSSFLQARSPSCRPTNSIKALKAVSTGRNTHPFNGPLSGITRLSRYQKGKTNLDFTEARDSEWQWHQLGHMQVCTSLQTDNHTNTPQLSFLQAGCPSCHPTNSSKHWEERQK